MESRNKGNLSVVITISMILVHIYLPKFLVTSDDQKSKKYLRVEQLTKRQ